jgi:tRNA (adenine37-N6)-methyltransferase
MSPGGFMTRAVGYADRHPRQKQIVFHPIGVVRSAFREPENRDWDRVVSEILVDRKWAEGLKGIEAFSHVIVLFHLSRARGVNILVHPKRRMDLPLVGMFSTRSPHRPNPIGLTICRLVKRRGTRLTVKGLDAIDGTPVIDIKPYIPDNDLVKRARAATWVYRLRSPGRRA